MNSSSVLQNAVKQSQFLYHCKSKILRNVNYCFHYKKTYSTINSEVKEAIAKKEKIQLTSPTVTKWKRPPFVKSFFFGKFDTELLAFPEILDNELLAELEKQVKDLNALFIEKVNSRQIDETGEIPADLLQDLKDLGLFGRMMPLKYGGLDLSYTACTRLNEVIGLDWSLYSMLTAHEFLASKVILLFGSEEQKNKYLPLLATGKCIAAFCAAEFESGSELISIASKASLTADDQYLISGTKCWVTNAEIADFFIVFAKTSDNMELHQNNVSVFIVDRNTAGITVTPHEKICLRGAKTGVVNFKEVCVPKKNLISEEGHGCQIYLKAMEHFRIAMNSFTFGTLKVLLDSVTERIINTERIEKSVGDLQLVRVRLSKILSRIYAMESMAYFTAAILDSTEDPDVTLESAALKIFNSEQTVYCVRELMELLGSTSLMKEQHLERFHRDALGLLMFDGPNDLVKLFIGLLGIKNVGDTKATEIMMARNTLFFPKNTLKILIKKIRVNMNRVKYDQDLAGHIHPSLTLWGNNLEEKLQKFELAVEETLTNHGRQVMETQLDPRKLADAAVYIYAEAAVLSRASRSYCIGLKNAQHEVDLAGAFCLDADTFLYNTINDIFIGVFRRQEATHLNIGGEVIDCRGYFPEHPLKHNF